MYSTGAYHTNYAAVVMQEKSDVCLVQTIEVKGMSW